MIRWALVSFVIAVVASIVELAEKGIASSFAGDVSIAALLFGVIVSLITWVSRDQMDEDESVGRPWSP